MKTCYTVLVRLSVTGSVYVTDDREADWDDYFDDDDDGLDDFLIADDPAAHSDEFSGPEYD